jgi:putative resolvase
MVGVKLSGWAREEGVPYRSALNWFPGTLPVPARQLPTGTILIDSPARAAGTAVAYFRVSGADQRAELERQAGRVTAASARLRAERRPYRRAHMPVNTSTVPRQKAAEGSV